MEENENSQQKTALRRPVRTIPQQEQKRERIKVWVGLSLVILALCIDGFQALLTAVGIGLVLGPVISVAAYTAFGIIFAMFGVSFIKSPKKLGVVGGSALIEIFLSFLPGFSAGVVAVVLMTMAEDKGGIIGKAASAAQGKIK